ncbi:MAG: hypothetical protein K6G40_06540 [Eubacterium sp.]|nr:hypothetical protein [Eubacterium sp.]
MESIDAAKSGMRISLLQCLTFSMANMYATGNTHYPDKELFINGVIIAVAGLLAGKVKWRDIIK